MTLKTEMVMRARVLGLRTGCADEFSWKNPAM
jgi:hypothetical protein